jgi:flagellar hook-associated protein 1 FlgK
VGTVGAVAARAASELDARQVILSQATLDVESVSGVNLEEEAATLLRFQQAYQAATKVVAIGDELFQTLLMAIR